MPNERVALRVAAGVDRVGRRVDRDGLDRAGLPAVAAGRDCSRRLTTPRGPRGVAGAAVEHRDQVRASAACQRGEVDRVGPRVDGDRVRVAARQLHRRHPATAGVIGRVAIAVAEHCDRPGVAGAGVGDVDGVGDRVDRDRDRIDADRHNRRFRTTSARAVGVAGPGVDHRDRSCAVGDICGGDGRVNGELIEQIVDRERARPQQRVRDAGAAAAPGLRVAARRVDHRDVIVDLVRGVERLRARVQRDSFGVTAGVDLERPDPRAGGEMLPAADRRVDDHQRVVLLIDDIDRAQRRIDGQPRVGLEARLPGAHRRGPVLGASRQIARGAGAQVVDRDRVVVVGRVQRVIRRVDLGRDHAVAVAAQRANRRAAAVHGRVAGVRVERRYPAGDGNVDGVRARVHIDVTGAAGNLDGRGLCRRARDEIARIAGRAVDHRDRVAVQVVEVRDIDRVVGFVGEDPIRAPPNRHRRRDLATACRVERVAGRPVEHRDGVIAVIGDVDRVAAGVDCDRARQLPNPDRRSCESKGRSRVRTGPARLALIRAARIPSRTGS